MECWTRTGIYEYFRVYMNRTVLSPPVKVSVSWYIRLILNHFCLPRATTCRLDTRHHSAFDHDATSVLVNRTVTARGRTRSTRPTAVAALRRITWTAVDDATAASRARRCAYRVTSWLSATATTHRCLCCPTSPSNHVDVTMSLTTRVCLRPATTVWRH